MRWSLPLSPVRLNCSYKSIKSVCKGIRLDKDNLQAPSAEQGTERKMLLDLTKTERLVSEFDLLAEKHRSIPAMKYNTDSNYKEYLTEVSMHNIESGILVFGVLV
jgi:hypothetical protein